MASVDSPPAPASTLEPEAWAEVTCRELLTIQAQNRKVSSEQRAELVEQHLRERISGVAASERRNCLRALATRFPLPESNLAGANGGGAPLSAGAWVAAFDSMKDGMTPELQKALLDKLSDAGFLPSAATGSKGIPLPATIEPFMPKEPVDPARVAQLVDVVLEATRALDGNFRRVWEAVADFGKTDPGLPRHSFDEIVRKFLMGDQDVPRVVLKTRVETTTKLIPAVLMAVKESWDSMEEDVRDCLPEEVQKRVKKDFLSNREAACWKEYVKLADKLHPDTRVREFFEQIVTKARAHIPR